MEYKRILTFNDFVGIKPAETDITMVAGEWQTLGTYTVPKGVRVAVGQRFDSHVYMKLETSLLGNIALPCRVRIVVSEPTGYGKRHIFSFDTRSCTVDSADKDLLPYLTLREPWILGDSKIIIEVYPETTNLVIDNSHAKTKLRLPITYRTE